MGFAKSSLISITDVFRVVDWNLPVCQIQPRLVPLRGLHLVSTVLWGRFYCGRVCAFGALTQLMDAVLPARWRVEVPRAIEPRAAWIKFGLLGGGRRVFRRDPRHDDLSLRRALLDVRLIGTTPMWIGVGVLLVATVFVRNLYCRFLCPVGAALGIISNLTVFRIKRWSECSTCRICQKTCEWGAIEAAILVTECVRCDDCERLYADEQKCPHWRILRRKGAKKSPLVAPELQTLNP